MSQTDVPLADNKDVDRPEDASVTAPLPYQAIPVGPAAADSIRARMLSIFALALIACLAVFHGWRPGYVLAPTDALQLVAPWQKPGTDYVARNEQLFDQTVQFVPWTLYTVERYKAGQIPLWNPHSQLGVPFLANGQSAIFYPTILLHLFLPETWSWTISAALRLFAAGLGVYLLAGRYGLRRIPRLLPAVAFMLCGFNVVWLNHPQTNVIVLLPWAVLATEMLIQRVTLNRAIGASVIFALQFLGGHPASSIHLLLTCALVWLCRLLMPQKGMGFEFGRALKSALFLVLTVAFGFALAAAQWLPLIEYAKNSGANLVRHERLANEPILTLAPSYLIGLVFPYANGFPDGVSPFEMRLATHLPNTNELAPGFVGTIPLFLAIFAAVVLRRQRVARLWIVLAIVSAAIAIKLPGVDHLVRHIPGLNVAQNGRLLVVTALALSLLAGFGLDALLHRLREREDLERPAKWLLRIAAGLAIVAVVCCVTLLAAKGYILRKGLARAEAAYHDSDRHEHTLDYVRAIVGRVHTELVFTSLRLLIPAALLAIAGFMIRRHSRRDGRSLACFAWPWLALAAIDLLAFAIPYNPGAPAETVFPETGLTQKFKELPPARFAATFRTMPPETSTAYGFDDLRGYDALAPWRYYKWWAHPGIGNLKADAQGYLNKLDNPEHPAWRLLNFGYLVTAPDQPAPKSLAAATTRPYDASQATTFSPVESPPDANIYQPAVARPRAWVARGVKTFEHCDDVLDRVAKMDFNPDEVVLLDKERIDTDDPLFAKEAWNNAGLSGGRSSVQFLPAARGDGDRPETFRVQVSGANGGYLVLADTYFPGWTATLLDDARNGGVRELPILPAYGVLRAVPLPQGQSAARIEFSYRPTSWRVGLLTSLCALFLLLILIGYNLFPKSPAPDAAQGMTETPEP